MWRWPAAVRAADRGGCSAICWRCATRCEVCGLDLRAHDAGDGAAVGVILVLGAIVVGLAFWVEFRFSPPLWVHAVLWPVVTMPLAVLMMRPAKAALVALQFRHRSTEMGL